MHRDRASGVEDHGTGNLSPRQGSALPHYVHQGRGFESRPSHVRAMDPRSPRARKPTARKPQVQQAACEGVGRVPA